MNGKRDESGSLVSTDSRNPGGSSAGWNGTDSEGKHLRTVNHIFISSERPFHHASILIPQLLADSVALWQPAAGAVRSAGSIHLDIC